MELLVKINKKLEQRRAILNTIIQNVGIQNKILKSAQILAECLKLGGKKSQLEMVVQLLNQNIFRQK